jgi:hypothetical protein
LKGKESTLKAKNQKREQKENWKKKKVKDSKKHDKEKE